MPSPVPTPSSRLIPVLALLACLLVAFAPTRSGAQGAPAPSDGYALVKHLIDEDAWLAMSPEGRNALVEFANADETGMVIGELCFEEGTDPRIVDAFQLALELNPEARFQHGGFSRWSTTATDGTIGSTNGVPCTVTYSFIPDGTTIPSELGFASGSSTLFASLNAQYGSPEAWQLHFHEVFARWGELNGVNYVYEPNDDGTPTSGLAGELGVRGDVRIGMKLLDGGQGVLAYNQGPQNGDMVFDSGDAVPTRFGRPVYLQNVTMHEHGHGHGLAHVCPVSQSKLMEPFISTAYHLARHDDARSSQRRYGDDLEDNDTQETATELGTRLFFYDFEDATIGDSVPAPFTQVSGTNLSGFGAMGGENWMIGDVASSTSTNCNFNGTTFTANATQFLYLNDDREAAADGGEDLAIRHEVIDTTGATSLRLNLRYCSDLDTITGWHGEVYARNGGAWTRVYAFLGDSLGWQSASIDLTPYIGATTQFAVRYNDINARAEGLAIDSIELVRDGRGFNIENVSIDDNGDVDWHTFTPAPGSYLLSLTVTPTGLAYLDQAQTSPCTATNTTDSLVVHNLSVEVLDASGSLVTQAAAAAGLPEVITDLAIDSADGPFFIRVFPETTTDSLQTYWLNVSLVQVAANPTVVMSSTALDPTNDRAIPLTITFSEDVTGFDEGAIKVNGATLADFAGGPAIYTATLNATEDGEVTAAIGENVATGVTSGLGNAEAAPFSRVVDTAAPTVVVATMEPSPTNTSPIACTATFSESVVGFTPADLVTTNATIENLAGDGTTYAFDLIPDDQGSVTVSIDAGIAFDAATNANAASNVLSLTFDSLAPTVDAITPETVGPTNASSVAFTVTFSEEVSGVNGPDDFIVMHNNTSSGGLTIDGGPDEFTVTVTGLEGGGEFTVAVATEDGIADAAGNLLAASPTSAAVTIDRIAPVLASVVVRAHNVLEATFSEPLTASALVGLAYEVSGPGQGSLALNPDEVVEDALPNTYLLSWDSGTMASGQEITLTVSGVSDLVGNAIDPMENSASAPVPTFLPSGVVVK